MPRPRVVVHVAVSIDGATGGFEPDVGRFYQLASGFGEDVTLAGADTILAQEESLGSADLPGPTPDAPILAVVDARRRVTRWTELRDCGYWSGVIALRGSAVDAPARPLVEEMVAGDDRVDLGLALGALGERGAEVVRVDSGGGLIGAMLERALVDELSLLVHPVVVTGPEVRRWYGRAASAVSRFTLSEFRSLDDGLVWLRYSV